MQGLATLNVFLVSTLKMLTHVTNIMHLVTFNVGERYIDVHIRLEYL